MKELNETVELDLGNLVDMQLSLDAWLVLYCVVNKNKNLLERYVTSVKPINTEVFKRLKLDGFLEYNDSEKITFSQLSATPKTSILFVNKQDEQKQQFEELFAELRNVYPKRVPAENGTTRPLHGDLARCKKLYHKIIHTKFGYDITLHKRILEAIKANILEAEKSRRLQYLQNLATYLHQQNYIQYFDVKVAKKIDFQDDI